MDAVLKSDIFFFVTSVAVVIIAAMLGVAIVYAIRILRDMKDVSTRVKSEAAHISEDIAVLRRRVRREGPWIQRIFALFAGLKPGARRRSRVREKGKEKESV